MAPGASGTPESPTGVHYGAGGGSGFFVDQAVYRLRSNVVQTPVWVQSKQDGTATSLGGIA